MSYPRNSKDSRETIVLYFTEKSSTRFGKTKRRFYKLDPVFDEKGIIRAEGRLNESNLPIEMKHPVLLPSEHYIVYLFALYHHRDLLHQGYRVVLANLSNLGILIGGGRELLKRIAAKCLFCRKRRHKLLKQQMGLLPSFRIHDQKAPFTFVAVDFFWIFTDKNKSEY